MQINKDISAQENILALFNEILEAYNKSVTLEEVDISQPSFKNAEKTLNSQVTITNKPDHEKLVAPVLMNYTRLSLPEILKRKQEKHGEEPIFKIDYDDYDTFTEEMFKESVLTKLNLHPTEVEIVVSEDETGKIAMVAPTGDSSNYLYYGELTITLTKANQD